MKAQWLSEEEGVWYLADPDDPDSYQGLPYPLVVSAYSLCSMNMVTESLWDFEYGDLCEGGYSKSGFKSKEAAQRAAVAWFSSALRHELEMLEGLDEPG